MTLLCVCQLPAPYNGPLVPAQRYIMTQRQEAKTATRTVLFGHIFGAPRLTCSRYACRPTTSCFICSHKKRLTNIGCSKSYSSVPWNLLWCVCANTSRDPCFLNFSHSSCVLSSDPHIVLLLTDARMHASVCVRVCARARARVGVCVRVCVCAKKAEPA